MIDTSYVYSSDTDTFTVTVDNKPSDILNVITTTPIADAAGVLVETMYNTNTGGLIQLKIVGLLSGFDNNDRLEYIEEDDTLHVRLHSSYSSEGLCDLVYKHIEKNALIALNRNTVGNLTGIEIVGLRYFIETDIDIRSD